MTSIAETVAGSGTANALSMFSTPSGVATAPSGTFAALCASQMSEPSTKGSSSPPATANTPPSAATQTTGIMQPKITKKSQANAASNFGIAAPIAAPTAPRPAPVLPFTPTLHLPTSNTRADAESQNADMFANAGVNKTVASTSQGTSAADSAAVSPLDSSLPVVNSLTSKLAPASGEEASQSAGAAQGTASAEIVPALSLTTRVAVQPVADTTSEDSPASPTVAGGSDQLSPPSSDLAVAACASVIATATAAPGNAASAGSAAAGSIAAQDPPQGSTGFGDVTPIQVQTQAPSPTPAKESAPAISRAAATEGPEQKPSAMQKTAAAAHSAAQVTSIGDSIATPLHPAADSGMPSLSQEATPSTLSLLFPSAASVKMQHSDGFFFPVASAANDPHTGDGPSSSPTIHAAAAASDSSSSVTTQSASDKTPASSSLSSNRSSTNNPSSNNPSNSGTETQDPAQPNAAAGNMLPSAIPPASQPQPSTVSVIPAVIAMSGATSSPLKAGNPPTISSIDSPVPAPAPAELPAAAASPVQLAQMASQAAQSEMRIGMTTSAFGSVEVRAVVHANDVGVLIGSEKGDLRSLLANDLPGITHNLEQQNLRLAQVNFQQGYAFSNQYSSGGDSQPRSFYPKSHSTPTLPGEATNAETAELPVASATASAVGLNILA